MRGLNNALKCVGAVGSLIGAWGVQVHYLGSYQVLTPIDSYFLIDCVNGGGIPKHPS